jgi:hypothetical protein
VRKPVSLTFEQAASGPVFAHRAIAADVLERVGLPAKLD